VTGWRRSKRLDERLLLRHLEINAELALRFPGELPASSNPKETTSP
jgi:hypothetical protein